MEMVLHQHVGSDQPMRAVAPKLSKLFMHLLIGEHPRAVSDTDGQKDKSVFSTWGGDRVMRIGAYLRGEPIEGISIFHVESSVDGGICCVVRTCPAAPRPTPLPNHPLPTAPTT